MVIKSLQDGSVVVKRILNAGFPFNETSSLPERGVALYLLDLEAMSAAASKWWQLLSPDEQERAARFHFERDRQYFCATRAALRSLLSAYLKAPPLELSFQYSDKGKPGLDSRYLSCGIEFNVSHSGGLALLGFTLNRHIGVDIEKIRNDVDCEAIARRFFSAREQEQLSLLPADQRAEAFFRCWTRKEAFIKALGEGLSHPLDQFDVSLDVSGRVSLVTRPVAEDARHWSLHAVDAGPGYAGAFAVSDC
jgi:4'-phosphopantetheinyl transferase